jgi:UDP-glucose 4-epimerase
MRHSSTDFIHDSTSTTHPRPWLTLPADVLHNFSEVAVTGGSGFVGRHLVTALQDLGLSVRVLDLAPPPAARSRHSTFMRVDLRNIDETKAAIAGADLVFHLAGNANGTQSVVDPRFDFNTNAVATFNVAEACAAAEVRMVYMSTASVYGTPLTTPIDESHPTVPFLPYGASKLSGENMVRALVESWGLSASIARSFVIYGPGEPPKTAGGEVSQFLRWQLNARPIPVVGDIDAKTRDFIHIHDVATALLVIAGRAAPGEVLNVGSGTETSLRELAEAVGKATGAAAEVTADTSVLEDSYRLVADISRLRALGFSPQVSLDQGLASLVQELGERPELPAVTAAFRRQQTSIASSAPSPAPAASSVAPSE